MDLQLIFDFLRQLSAHNDREWFQEHKMLYHSATQEFDKLLTILISRVGEFDPSVRHLQPKDCTWRIYRDVRFSPDKRPYKTHISQPRARNLCTAVIISIWNLKAAFMQEALTVSPLSNCRKYAIPSMTV